MYGFIGKEMTTALEGLVKGKRVWNLGCGTGSTEPQLLKRLGATSVYAVDKARRNHTVLPNSVTECGVITWCDMYYIEFMDKFTETADVALIKWPDNGPLVGMVPLLAKCDVVVYVGTNAGFTACGNQALWRYLANREFVSDVKGHHNDMIVYGKPVETATAPRCREEELAWMAHGMAWSSEPKFDLPFLPGRVLTP